MALKVSQTQIQKPILAPSLQQSISVLLLPVMELSAIIEQELQSNPLLEMDETHPDHLERMKEGDLQSDLERLTQLQKDRKIRGEHIQRSEDDDNSPQDRLLTQPPTLEEHLLQQLRLEFSDPLKLKIGELIIGNLDEDGYLQTDCLEIAELLGLKNTEEIETILEQIQQLGPPGVAARDLEECLLLQLMRHNFPEEQIIRRVIKAHLPLLGRKKFQEIAKDLRVSAEKIRTAAQCIATLDPKPARNFRPIDTNIYIQPDVLIRKDEQDRYQVIISKSQTPPLRINTLYKNLLDRKNLSPEEKTFIREKLTNAVNFIKSISQRGQTIRQISEHILKHQREFFDNENGNVAPMSLKDVADAIERCESTISRAISNKYIDTPKGLYPMKFFFSHAVQPSVNGQVSAQSIKEELQELIDAEDKSSPLSDKSIQEHFKSKGMHLARRTLTKYRKVLGILPSYLRKE